ncbi:MAG: hypothetical protein Q7J65_00965 [Candidatus Marinimicrobia bacterium]|nr:hypothetical protein [Candidatus Neomarinimicrobiota bacterium]
MKKIALFCGIFVSIVLLSSCSDKNYQSHFDLGKWYSEKGLINEAILEFKAATRADPEQYKAHHHLAIAYTKKGWYEYAIQEAETAFDLHPSDATYKLIQVIRDKKSLESYQDIIEKEPLE